MIVSLAAVPPPPALKSTGCSFSVQVIDVIRAKSGLYSNGTRFVPAFGGNVNYKVECCEERGDDEDG